MNSYCRIYKDPSPYDVADFLIFLWLIRLFAEAKNNKLLIKLIVEKMAKPEMFSDDKWREVLESFEVRKEQLKEKLFESERYYSEKKQQVFCERFYATIHLKMSEIWESSDRIERH